MSWPIREFRSRCGRELGELEPAHLSQRERLRDREGAVPEVGLGCEQLDLQTILAHGTKRERRLECGDASAGDQHMLGLVIHDHLPPGVGMLVCAPQWTTRTSQCEVRSTLSLTLSPNRRSRRLGSCVPTTIRFALRCSASRTMWRAGSSSAMSYSPSTPRSARNAFAFLRSSPVLLRRVDGIGRTDSVAGDEDRSHARDDELRAEAARELGRAVECSLRRLCVVVANDDRFHLDPPSSASSQRWSPSRRRLPSVKTRLSPRPSTDSRRREERVRTGSAAPQRPPALFGTRASSLSASCRPMPI